MGPLPTSLQTSKRQTCSDFSHSKSLDKKQILKIPLKPKNFDNLNSYFKKKDIYITHFLECPPEEFQEKCRKLYRKLQWYHFREERVLLRLTVKDITLKEYFEQEEIRKLFHMPTGKTFEFELLDKLSYQLLMRIDPTITRVSTLVEEIKDDDVVVHVYDLSLIHI